MNLKELEYIVALADEKSISKAADRLYMAQSSLSEFLRQYERELGTTLFFRTSKGIRPTAGEKSLSGMYVRSCGSIEKQRMNCGM